MAGPSDSFLSHVGSKTTSLARCWGLTRRDGMRFGFTDHDRDLAFEGWTFRADTGLSARALQQGAGLAVDNSAAQGALSDAALREEDIEAGRFDGADLSCWLVNWQEVSCRWLQFRGSIGELFRAGGAFEAELRGLTQALNRPLGRIYQKPCTAVLGERACGFDLALPGYHFHGSVAGLTETGQFQWPEADQGLDGFEPGWFRGGRLTVTSGAAAGLWAMIKDDETQGGYRILTLWAPLRAMVQSGDQLRLEAGCDKRMQTCRLKFNNLANFQGFPDIPGEDWEMAVAKSSARNSGGSRR